MLKLSSFIFTLLAFATSAVGNIGHFVGNGGIGVYCPNAATDKVRLYDVFEGEELLGLQLDFGSATNVSEMLALAFDRIAIHSPQRAERYRQHAAEFVDESTFLSSANLVSTEDLNTFLKAPDGCEFRQIVIQRQPDPLLKKRYFVNEPLFKMMSKKHQAALLLHEVIYREAIEYGHTNSRQVRYFNTLVFSDSLKSMERLDFYDLLTRIDFERFEVAGVTLDLKKRTGRCGEKDFRVDHHLHVGLMGVDAPLTWGDGAYVGPLSCDQRIEVHGATLSYAGADFRWTVFDSDWNLRTLPVWRVDGEINIRGNSVKLDPMNFSNALNLRLYANGAISRAVLQLPLTLRMVGGAAVTCLKGSFGDAPIDTLRVHFDDQHFVTRIEHLAGDEPSTKLGTLCKFGGNA